MSDLPKVAFVLGGDVLTHLEVFIVPQVGDSVLLAGHEWQVTRRVWTPDGKVPYDCQVYCMRT